jgi:hypothetical protein
MNKLEILTKKFNFLKEFEDKTYNNVKVQRIDADLLKKTGYEYYWDGSMGETSKYQKYFIVVSTQDNEKGYKILEVPTDYESGSNYAGSQTVKSNGMKIIDFLVEKDVSAEQILGIVEVKRILEDWPGSEYINERFLTLHLPPKNIDLLKQEIEKAKEELIKSVEEEIRNAVGE